MEKRIDTVGAPCELYTESDLFVRTIRDILRPSIEAIVVDSDHAYERAEALLRVVAPRTGTQLVRYRSSNPIFHAYDIERQIDLIHEREVPLPSGGKLVIEQTEALVAIDVNSGRSRSARDSETNAYQTNCEAVDEICRQLRLRDLGGLVINDLIDMRMTRHKRQIEERFKEHLSRDRAKTTMLKISEFGIVELTRQRMRPSLRKAHFTGCPQCEGRGEIKSPESVGADATRQAKYLLQFDRVRRIEMVCSPRVASVMLSGKRRELVQLEEESGKTVDVRVSDTIAVDRVDFYAYDERNADIDVSRLPSPKRPSIKDLLADDKKFREQAERAGAEAPGTDGKKRRRRRKTAPADATAIALAASAELAAEADAEDGAQGTAEEGTEKKRRSRRRGGRGRGGGRKAEAAVAETNAAADKQPANKQPADKHPAGQQPSDTDKAPRCRPTVTSVKEAAIRIHQLAKELDLKSRDVLAICRERCDDVVKSHMSSVSPASAELIRQTVREQAAAASDTADALDQVAAPGREKSRPSEEARDGAKRRTRRSRRGGRRRGRGSAGEDAAVAAEQPEAAPVEEVEPAVAASGDDESDKPRRRRGRRGRGGRGTGGAGAAGDAAAAKAEPEKKKKTRRSSRSRRAASADEEAKEQVPVVATTVNGDDEPKPRRSLYGRGRRTLSRSAAKQLMEESAE